MSPNALQTVSGVASVNVYGSPRAVRIEVDPRKLYARGLTFSDINAAVKANTTLQSAGQIKGNTIQLTVKPQTQLEKAADYGDLIIAYKNGAPVYLHDIADVRGLVTDGRFENWPTRPADSSPVPSACVLAVSKMSGANNIEVAKGVLALLPVVRASMPQSIQIIPIYNRAISIENSVEGCER